MSGPEDPSGSELAAGAFGALVESSGKEHNPDEQLSAALEEMSQYKQELENALEDSNARLMNAEKELEEVRGQWDDARARLDASSEREKDMETQMTLLQKQLDQANRDLEKERKHWQEQYQAEKDMSEQLRGTLEAVRLQLESEAQKYVDETEQQRLSWVAKEKELWSMVDAARSAAAEAASFSKEDTPTMTPGSDARVHSVPTPGDNVGVPEESEVDEPAEEEKQTVKSSEKPVGQVNGDIHDEDVDEKKGLKKSLDLSTVMDVDTWVSAATCGDGSTTPLAVNEAALRKNLQSAMARLECMQEIQEKWRKQVERMDEVETEWKARHADLEQERDDLAHEVELLQEDLRREQDLAMEAGMVAEEEWRKRQEAERSMAELQREVAKQKKVAREALMCIPRATLEQMDMASLAGGQSGSPMISLALSGSVSADVGDMNHGEMNDLSLLDLDRGHGVPAMDDDPQEQDMGSYEESAHQPEPFEKDASAAEDDTPATLEGVSLEELQEEGVMEDAGGLADLVSGLKEVAAAAAAAAAAASPSVHGFEESEAGMKADPEHHVLHGVPHTHAAEHEQKSLDAQESLLRLGQEVGTLRKEVLELRLKLAEVRNHVVVLEDEKKELELKHAFGHVCLQLVTNAKDKFEDQIAMATRHALEASQKARETDKQLFALLADISSLLKEHQVQAKNNGSTYNRYKIGKQEIDIVKEDLRQLVKFVQMKATLAEKGRQKNKTKAAADAARPRLAELRDGVAQEEEVLAELEKELHEAKKRTEEAEQMQAMVAAMREKERQVRENVEKEVRAVQAKMQEAEIMKQQVEALKQTEQVLAKELAEEVKELKVKSLEAEEVEGRISALEATEAVIREEMEAKTKAVRSIDREFPRLMGLGLGSELPPPGLLGRKQSEENAWRQKRKVLEDLKVMKEQLIWTQSSLLKSRQRLPELIQESKDCKRRVEEKEKETKRVQQWLKDHDAGLTGGKGGDDGLRKSLASSWSWWKKKDEVDGPSRLSGMPMARMHQMGNLLPLGSNSSDEHEQAPRTPSSTFGSPRKQGVALPAGSPARPGHAVGHASNFMSPGKAPMPSSPLTGPFEGRRSSETARSSSPAPWPQQHLAQVSPQRQQGMVSAQSQAVPVEDPVMTTSPIVLGSDQPVIQELTVDLPQVLVYAEDQ